MTKDLIRGSLLVLSVTVVLGVGYPLAMTGVAQVLFPGKADGSLVRQDGKVVGSTLLGQARLIDTGTKGKDGEAITRPDPKYFQPRPSATGYSATVTYFANRGPNQKSTRELTKEHIDAYLALEGRYSPGLTAAKVPVDAATFSASGVDPQISEANAGIQARRIAAVRRLPLGRVQALIDDNTDGRALGVFGEPGVNVTTLNLALDQGS